MTEDELAQAQIDQDRWAASQAAGYTPSEKAAMQAFIAKNAKKWALPTTGNLAYDDYRRSSEAFGKAARGAITGYTPTVTTGEGTEYYQEIAGSPIYGASVGNPDLYFQDWLGSMSPQQQAEYESLQDAHHDKITSRMQLAALAAFGGIAGAGMLGAGMLGSGALGGGGGIGALGGAEGLAAADIAGGLIPAFGTDAGYAAGLGGLAGAGGAGLGGAELAGIAGNNISAWLPAGSEALGAGAASVPAWALPGGASAAELAAMGLGGSGGGSSWLQQLGSLLGGGGGTGGGTSGLGSLLGGGGGTNWLNLLGNLGGGYLQSQAAGNATDAQLQAARESNALLEKMWQQGRTDQAPYREAGTSALAGIQALLKDPSSITTMPDYQFGFDQGSKALQNSATARGTTYSGQQAKALQRYGNDYAGTKLSDSYNRLANLAGLGQVSTNQTGNLGANYANNLANNIEAQGNTQGSAYIGKGSAWNNAIGGALNGLSEQALIDALLKGGG